MPRTRRMFLGSNSSIGFYSLFDQIFSEDLNRYFIIKGGPGTGKSMFMKRIGESVESLGLDIEYYHCSSDSDSLDGLFIPKLKIALVDGTTPHVIEPKYPVLIDEILDFAQFLDRQQLLRHKKDIITLSKEASFYFRKTYMQLKQAAIVYEEIKLMYNKPINLKLARQLLYDIFKDAPVSTNALPKSKKFFASAITPQGVCNYYNTLIDSDMKIYSLKGAMGLVSKDILTKIAINAHELGLDTEIFCCPFKPNTIDMIIIPILNTAVIDNSSPYQATNILKDRPKNIIEIPVYTDEVDTRLIESFNHLIDNSITNLVKAKSSRDVLEKIYSEAMDFSGVDNLYYNILNIIRTQVEM